MSSGYQIVTIGEVHYEKMERLVKTLNEQFEESARIQAEIRKNLEGLGYGI